MALKIKSTTSQDQSTKVVTFTETTGVFDVINNLTGYGIDQIPTTQREVADILNAHLYILPKDEVFSFEGGATPVTGAVVYEFALNFTQAQDVANGSVIPVNLLRADPYPDGVYKFLYFNWFDGTDVLTPDGSNIVTVPDFNEFLNATYVKINGLIYEITGVNDDNTITTNVPVPIAVDVPYQVAYLTTNYYANTYDINVCLHKKIAELALKSCGCCASTAVELNLALMVYFSIDIQIDELNYTKAEEAIKYISKFCGGCGCGCK
jgi:hypothetical protein